MRPRERCERLVLRVLASMSMTRAVELAAAVFLLVGCDPGWSVQGVVIGPDGMAVPGARVAFECPSGHADAPVTTDAQGRFELGGVGRATESARCTLAVSKAGFAERRLPATDACHRSTSRGNFGTPCDPREELISLEIEDAPTSAP